MILDMHIHTNRYSGCSNIEPGLVIPRAREAGLDGIVLTEHGIRWPDGEVDALVKGGGSAEFLVFPAEEVACYSAGGAFQGEFLVLGYPESLGSNKTADRLIEMVHDAGGVVLAAHPFKRLKTGDGYYGSGLSALKLKIDGLETEHPSYGDAERELARKVMEAMGIAGIGSSDAHDLAGIGKCRTVFERDVRDMKSLCDEIRAGRLRAVGAR
jgi:predicted metal-dependent phosphoesterase TrpH